MLFLAIVLHTVQTIWVYQSCTVNKGEVWRLLHNAGECKTATHLPEVCHSVYQWALGRNVGWVFGVMVSL